MMADFGQGLRCEVNPRARRISLRLDVADRCVVLVRPKRASETLVASFVAGKRGWIEQQLATLPEQIAFADGLILPMLGEDRVVRSSPSGRSGVWSDNQTIFVSGAAEHLPRRLRDWLKAEARKVFAEWARDFSECLGVKVTRVSVRDTTSRWGSCTRDGRLSLSWRLILAPRDVAAYVVAHEVAHLKQLNHSPAFWRVVAMLVDDLKKPRAWLRRHGASLHRFN